VSTEARQQAAAGYIAHGYAPIPIPADSKNPNRPDWQGERHTSEDVPRCWTNGQNVGVLTGEPSGWRVDVDLDSDEAVRIAGRFLPPTLTSGRESRPHSHWWYVSQGARSQDWKAPDGDKLVELRSTGRQTLVWPSTHPDGDTYLWHRASGLEMAEAGAGELVGRLRELATAALIARHVPPAGGRHDFALALAGFLLRPGRLDEGTTLRLLLAAWHAAGADSREAVRDLEGIVRDTAERLRAGAPVVGGPTLEETAPGFVKAVCKWWAFNGYAGDPESAGVVPEGGYGVLLSEVQPERVSWLWPGRIPRGKITLIDGDPGLGKSAATTDLAARVTAGAKWPDGTPCERGGVVILSAEDGLADTIRPRFDAAGGDPSEAVAVSTVPDSEGNERQIAIPDDLAVIEAAIERVGAVLVVIDPLMAFLPGDVNSHRDQDVRRALAPLARLAERAGAAIVVIRHLNKTTGGNALYRGGGSIGIVGAARSGLLIAAHPEDDGRRVMASMKSNLAAPAPSLVFGLEPAENGAVRVDWKGESTLDASALLSAPTDPEERSVLQEAKDLLRETLSEGPVPAAEVKQEARSADISERTLKSAKRELGVLTSREGEAGKRGGGQWVWALPAGPVSIKGVKPEGLHPKPGADRTDAKNPAYPSQKRPEGLRVQSGEDIKGITNVCPLNGTLSADDVAAETRRSKSGPALALATYLEKPSEERLEWLARAVLTVRGMDTADWRQHAEATKKAAGDPANHPLDCPCRACA